MRVSESYIFWYVYTDIIFATCHLEISGISEELWVSGLHFVGFVYSISCKMFAGSIPMASPKLYAQGDY